MLVFLRMYLMNDPAQSVRQNIGPTFFIAKTRYKSPITNGLNDYI